jgi:hypothetical protein
VAVGRGGELLLGRRRVHVILRWRLRGWLGREGTGVGRGRSQTNRNQASTLHTQRPRKPTRRGAQLPQERRRAARGRRWEGAGAPARARCRRAGRGCRGWGGGVGGAGGAPAGGRGGSAAGRRRPA